MSERPDSDPGDCAAFEVGRPGTGVLYYPGRRAPRLVRSGNGWTGATTRERELIGAAMLLMPCQGDGHYMCQECVFFDAAGIVPTRLDARDPP